MTHIEPEIQEDCLLLTDAIMETFPSLLITASKTVLNNLLEQISHKHKKTSSTVNTSEVSRVLTVNPNQQLTTRKWRLKVMTRVKMFIYQLVISSASSENSKSTQEYSYKKDQRNHVFIKPQGTLFTPDIKLIDFYSPSAASFIFTEEIDTREIISSLMPVLIEMWVEACPQLHANKAQGR